LEAVSTSIYAITIAIPPCQSPFGPASSGYIVLPLTALTRVYIPVNRAVEPTAKYKFSV
jgi:hypothetical protein